MRPASEIEWCGERKGGSFLTSSVVEAGAEVAWTVGRRKVSGLAETCR
jgi:hypothetical protein